MQWPQQDPTSIAEWWEQTASKIQKRDRRRFNNIVIYIMWNLWKEGNGRIFENMHKTAQQVASLTKEDIAQRHRALNFAEGSN
jgi:hypothetical protein